MTKSRARATECLHLQVAEAETGNVEQSEMLNTVYFVFCQLRNTCSPQEPARESRLFGKTNNKQHILTN